MRDMSVARPAPSAPIGSAPRCPKMNTQLSSMFRALVASTIHMAIEVLPMPSRNCLNDRKIISGRMLQVSMSK